MKEQIEKHFNLKVVEKEISIHELINSAREGRLLEMFGASTHSPLQPVSRVVFKDTTMVLDQFTQG